MPTATWAAQARSLPHEVLAAKVLARHFNIEKIDVPVSDTLTLPGKILVPSPRALEEPRNSKLPALLIFGGFEEAGKVLELLAPKIPILVASFDYPFEPPRKFKFPESFKYAPEARRAVHDTIAGIEALAAELKKRSDVDPSRITVVGASFGAPFALAAAASSPDITGVVIVHGFGDIPGTVTRILTRNWRAKLDFAAEPLAWLVAHAGWLYLNAPSPEASARKLTAGQRVLMISADADSIIPPSSIEKLWQSLESSRAPHERISMPGDHLQPGASELIAKITDLVTDWMGKSDLR